MYDDLAVELALSAFPMALEEWRLALGILTCRSQRLVRLQRMS
jgi:hypothetical protein